VVGEYRRARELAGGARPFSRGFRSPEQRVSFGSSARWWRLLRRSDAGRRPRSRSRSVRRSRLSNPRRWPLRWWVRICRLLSAGGAVVEAGDGAGVGGLSCVAEPAPAQDSLTPKFSRMRRRRNSAPAPEPGAACRLQRTVRPPRCDARERYPPTVEKPNQFPSGNSKSVAIA
jgi:hypothetical protein